MSLLAMAVGIKQKKKVNEIVNKFPHTDFVIMLFHYDGLLNEWNDLEWSSTAIHISAINQTKWYEPLIQSQTCYPKFTTLWVPS